MVLVEKIGEGNKSGLFFGGLNFQWKVAELGKNTDCKILELDFF